MLNLQRIVSPARRRVVTGLLFTALSFILLTGLAGCSGQVQETLPPEELYQRAVTAFEDEDYPQAAQWAQQLREEYPFNPLASEAELLEADVYFARKEYMAAAAAYQAFEELHPTHPRVDYAMMRQGLSYHENIPSVDRDQTPSRQTARIFARLLATHPDSPHAPEVQEKLTYAREQLAGHEMYVGRYYLRKKEHRAALTRFQVVVQEFSDTSHATEAMKLALQAQAELDKRQVEQEQAAQEQPEQEPDKQEAQE